MSAEIGFVTIANPRTVTSDYTGLLNSREHKTSRREMFCGASVFLKHETADELTAEKEGEPVRNLGRVFNSCSASPYDFEFFTVRNEVIAPSHRSSDKIDGYLGKLGKPHRSKEGPML